MSIAKGAACVLLLWMAVQPAPARAGAFGDEFGRCLVVASTDADRQQLMEWIFAAIALNPAIAPYARVDAGERARIDRGMAGLFSRLVGEDCREQAGAALRYEGPAAFETAFELLGKVAGQQIFASPEVAGGAMGFQKHLDMEALGRKLGVGDGG